MIDGVPEVKDLIASGLASAERDKAGRTVYRLHPAGQAQISAALAARGRAARAKTAGREVAAILCGGEPSTRDRESIAAFAAALALDDERDRRAAILDIELRNRVAS